MNNDVNRRWRTLQKAISAVLYDEDPDGMGSRVSAPSDEYDDVAIRIISALSKDAGARTPHSIVRDFYRNRRIVHDVVMLWFEFASPTLKTVDIDFEWPVFIAEGLELQAFASAQQMNDELEPWYGDLPGNVVWDYQGKPLSIRRVGDSQNDMDGQVVLASAPQLEQQSLDEYLAEWLRVTGRASIAVLPVQSRRSAALAFSLPERRRALMGPGLAQRIATWLGSQVQRGPS